MGLQRMMLATLTGVVIGILIAPAKGSETRQKISDSAENFKSKIRRFRSASHEELDELKEELDHEVVGLKEETRRKILKLIRSARSRFNNVQNEAFSNG